MAASLCAVALIWLVAARIDDNRHRQAVAQAYHKVREDANQLAVEWEARLTLIGALHSSGRAVLRTPPGSAAREEALADLRATVARSGSGVVIVTAVARDGSVLWSTGNFEAHPPHFAGRRYFKAIFTDGLVRFAGRPAIGFATGDLDIPFAGAVPGPDGTVNALTVVSMPVSVIRDMTRYFEDQGASVAALIRDDGVVLAREPPPQPGALIPQPDALFRQALVSGMGMGTEISALDGVTRYYAVRRLAGTALFVAVGLDEAVPLAAVQAQQRDTDQIAIGLGVLVLLVCAVCIVGLRWRHHALQRQARLQTRLDNQAFITDIASAATDMIILLDAELRYVYCNKAYQEFFGAELEQFIGRRLGSRLLTEDSAHVAAAIAAIAAGARSHRVVFRVRRTDDAIAWLEAELVSIGPDDPDPAVPHLLVIIRDVTERISSQVELAEAQDHVRSLLRMGQGHIIKVTLDPSGAKKAIMVSPLSPDEAQQEFAGCDVEDGMLVTATLLEDQPLLQDWYLRCRAERRSTVEFRYHARDGAIRWRRAQGVLLDSRADGFDVLVYATDITAERDARQRLKLSERLATLGEVTTHLAHEISQPVTTIALDADFGMSLLEDEPADVGRAVDALRRIERQTNRIVEIIRHIRKFGHGSDVRSESFEITEALMATELLVQSKLRQAGVTLHFNDTSAIGKLSLPRIPLEQVLINLLSNASDAYAAQTAIPRGQRRITVTVRRESDLLVITVADHAGGIPDALRERIFDPFFTTKGPNEGTGVGLSISRSLIVEMGGTMTVRNEANGAIFELCIKLPPSDAEPVRRAVAGV